MEKIYKDEYNTSMGILIDVSDPVNFPLKKVPGSIYIPYEKLLYHHSEFLNKNKKYYICCNKGIKSKRLVSILEVYGYNVGQLLKDR